MDTQLPIWVSVIISLAGAGIFTGALEAFKYFFTIKKKKRQEEADTKSKESEAEMAEISAFEKRLKLMSEEMLEQEKKIQRQREKIDSLDEQLALANETMAKLKMELSNVQDAYEKSVLNECEIADCNSRVRPKNKSTKSIIK